VYGRQPGDLTHVPEDYPGAPDPLDPRSAYGIGKRTAEQLCALYQKHYGVSSTIARCFAFVGPYLPLDIHFAIGNFIRDVMNAGPIVIKGDGTPYRSYLYAADLAIWLWTILLRGAPGSAYNVGSEESISIAEVAKRVVRSASSDVKIEIQGRKQINQTVERYVPSTQKAITELKLQQTIDLDKAIQYTVQFLKSKTQELLT
jgi:dTDP-glucose 4,6-dehydratase